MDHREAGRLGGIARAEKLSAERRRAIARMGWEALVRRRFGGDRDAAKAWLVGAGRFASRPTTAEQCLRFAARQAAMDLPDHPTEDDLRAAFHRLVGTPPQTVEEPDQEEEDLPF